MSENIMASSSSQMLAESSIEGSTTSQHQTSGPQDAPVSETNPETTADGIAAQPVDAIVAKFKATERLIFLLENFRAILRDAVQIAVESAFDNLRVGNVKCPWQDLPIAGNYGTTTKSSGDY
ncbi:hypothetical protein G7Y79_00006g019880 [Physcia stellaris]|nr:hypothetical protein G7Y79_00006g019880 [Physcia stellaris]